MAVLNRAFSVDPYDESRYACVCVLLHNSQFQNLSNNASSDRVRTVLHEGAQAEERARREHTQRSCVGVEGHYSRTQGHTVRGRLLPSRYSLHARSSSLSAHCCLRHKSTSSKYCAECRLSYERVIHLCTGGGEHADVATRVGTDYD